jgi:hypothetical protein
LTVASIDREEKSFIITSRKGVLLGGQAERAAVRCWQQVQPLRCQPGANVIKLFTAVIYNFS